MGAGMIVTATAVKVVTAASGVTIVTAGREAALIAHLGGGSIRTIGSVAMARLVDAATMGKIGAAKIDLAIEAGLADTKCAGEQGHLANSYLRKIFIITSNAPEW